jgi:hypothetical protein
MNSTTGRLASVAQSAAPESQGRMFDSCQEPEIAFFAAVLDKVK